MMMIPYKPIGRPESTRWLLVGASMMLSACSALTTTPASTPAAEVRPAEPASLVKVSPLQNPEVEESMPRERREGRVLLEQVGSGGFVEPAASRGPATTSGGVNVNFENAPIVDVLAAILGDLLRVPYSLEGDVKGDITLMTTQPVPQDALLDLLESVLESKGIVIVKGSNGLYRVGSGAALRREVPLAREAASQRGYSIRIMPLRYLSVVEAQKLMEPLGMSESVLRADPVRNILILGASAPQMQNIDRTLRMLDVDVFKGMSFGVYEIVNLEAQTIVERLNAMMGTPEAAAMSNVTKLIALEEINSVMVITPQPDQLDNIRTWLKRLDELGIDDAKAGEQLYVYHVQNGQAAHLANLLGQVFGAGSASSAAQTSGTVAPGLAQSALSSSGETSTAAPSKASGGVSSATAESGARIVADESNNSLLVRTTAKEWRELRAALARIDRTPAQVLVEVSIWEVTLKDELNYGVEWFFNSQGGATGTAKGGLLSFNESGSVARAAPGFSYLFRGSDWRGVINTLASQSNVRSLSSPSVLVLDNKEANIQVGNQQPIQTSQTVNTGNTGVVTQNVELKDTGVQLTVKPRVNAGGLVIMDIKQEVTDVGERDAATGQRSFLKRSIETSVAIQGGDTIILGGLIQDRREDTSGGVPFLHRLPLVGALFGSTGDSENRTELLVTITPRAVNQYRDFEQIGDEFRRKMGGVMRAFEEQARVN